MASLIGKEIGKYRITERIGRGGMADVYLGIHTHLDRKVAVKVLHSHLLEGGDFVARFKREAKAVANLRHPNIVQVYDFDVQDDLIFMVMEYIDGSSLHSRLVEAGNRGERLPIKLIGSIINDIAGALDYAHSQGMLHRDIKPSNILLDKNDKAFLTDFGIAKLLDDQKFTATGTLVGTPAYMSPEQGLGEELTEESDIYSLGIVAFEMLTGQVPYDAKTPIAIVHKQINDPVPNLSDLVDDVPLTAQEVLNRALAKNPQGRFTKAEELVAALRTALTALESTQPLVGTAPSPGDQGELDAPTVTMQDPELGKATVVMEDTKQEPIPPQPAPRKDQKPAPAPRKQEEKKKIPAWALIAGGAVLLIGIAVVLTQVLDLELPGGAPAETRQVLDLELPTETPVEVAPEPIEVVFSPEGAEGGLFVMDEVPDGNYQNAERAGRQVIRTGNNYVLPANDGNTTRDSFLYFDIDDSILVHLPEGSSASVYVTYLDQGTDRFDLQYDAHSGGDWGDGRFVIVGEVTKTGSGDFLTAQFDLEDALFNNRINGGDFRISDIWDGPETILEVRLVYNPLGQTSTSDGAAALLQAQQHFDNGSYTEAIDAALLALDAGNDSYEVYHLIGRSYHSLGECGQAMDFLDSALEREPDYYWSLYHRGSCQFELGNTDQAIQDLTRATEVDPANQAAWSVLAKTYYLSGEDQHMDAALQAFNQALSIDPANYENLVLRGELLWYVYHDTGAALADLSLAIESAPADDPWAYNTRGLMYLQSGQYALCIADYDEVVLRAGNENLWAFIERGECFYGLKQYDAARSDFDHFMMLTEDDPGAWSAERDRVQAYLAEMP